MAVCNFISDFEFGNECPVELNFNFIILKSFYCTKCKNKTTKEENFIDIILNLNEEKNVSNLLNSFFGTEKIEKKCEKCENKESAVTNEIKKLPKCFILQLKRFEPQISSDNEFSLIKVKQEIEILKEIDFTQFCNIQEEEEGEEGKGDFGLKKRKIDFKFELKSIIVHSGKSPNHGHYTCLIKNEEENWFECNDDIITKKKSEDSVLNDKSIKKNAYILFYEMKSETETEQQEDKEEEKAIKI